MIWVFGCRPGGCTILFRLSGSPNLKTLFSHSVILWGFPIIEKICFSPTARPLGLSELKNSVFSFYHPIGISEGKKHF